ncbi:hypothetical protein TanjilG_03341 [Lupinus angustifolius]|uniref:Lipoxygenase n=2 Tax=Lupinus angustifolius TaxID=3871 RepID=A0A4P1RDV4_LUPAN|nr:hypothetical protein TanjilG_03341 [Lupinus angustifolius]
MLMPQSYLSNSSPSVSCVTHTFQKPCLHGTSYYPSFQVGSRPLFQNKRSERIRARNGYNNSSNKIKAVAVSEQAEKKTVKVKATITVHLTVGGFFSDLSLERGADDITDLVGKSLLLELVSTTLNPKTKTEKDTIKGFAQKTCQIVDKVKYEAEFEVPHSFGEIGAIYVENEHHKEMFVTEVVFEGFPTGPFHISCNSWVHSKIDSPAKRVFFSNKSYLPSETPEGLKRIRGEKLVELRGNGEGERKKFESIYDYDVYNDIGDPDTNIELKRPILGGKQNPYPRRCRTGRPSCKTDPLSEERVVGVYVPRDECFSGIKQLNFKGKSIYSVLHALIPSLEAAIVDKDLGFPVFSAIDDLFNEGIKLPLLQGEGFLSNILPRLIKFIKDVEQNILRFETPATMDRDRFFWFRDEEFARQTLAGVNPFSIQLVTEWPLKSKLDPNIYGRVESAITTETIEEEIRGFMTVEEAIKQKKLFILDYHDLLLPVVEKVRELEGTTLYGSRTLFFLNNDSTLRPLAIELTRPPINGEPQWKEVFTPAWHSTGVWLWRLAKAHVLAHDSGYHQLVSHWLRTHCAAEPYIIATNRQLSAMHPIYRLLHPHFRYTMEINAFAREVLINANGSIENSFSPGKYSMLLSSIVYDKQWQFDLQALPADLINRGLAVEDPNAPHGLKLTIEDYPYANDGLILWDALKGWVTDYVNHYYAEPRQVESDKELQAWWEEIRTVGHGDKKDEPWWPVLKNKEDLVGIVTTIVWITSGHHAAVNFGQYHYAGYFPNRPTITRCNMPTEDHSDPEWELFLKKPEATLLNTFPSQIQATTVMTVMDILSTHSTDEEYLGETLEPAWAEVPIVKSAFEKFKGKLMELEGIVDERNADRTRKNRNGAGIVPYELMKPKSEPGVTGKGVPYSISI